MNTLPEHLDHPAVSVKCAVCPTFKEHVSQCEEIHCCWASQRRGYQQRVEDDTAREKDAKAKEDGKCL